MKTFVSLFILTYKFFSLMMDQTFLTTSCRAIWSEPTTAASSGVSVQVLVNFPPPPPLLAPVFFPFFPAPFQSSSLSESEPFFFLPLAPFLALAAPLAVLLGDYSSIVKAERL